MSTIREFFVLGHVLARDLKTAEDLSPPDPTLIHGLELEIEYADPEWGDMSGWQATEDGSLRNEGWEYISDPQTFNSTMSRLKAFFRRAEQISFDPNNSSHYSERTSIHVHTNCQDLTIEQLSTILLLYQVTEDLIYQFVGSDRQDNIFCVPWSQTQITYETVSNLKYFIQTISIDRNKYTGLNLVPLQSLGTIEWRHMPGHCDLGIIENWLRIIGHYYRIARSIPFEEVKDKLVNLNSTSQYEWLIDWLFQAQAPLMRFPAYRQMLENGVLNMKYSLLKPKKVKDSPYINPFVWHEAPNYLQGGTTGRATTTGELLQMEVRHGQAGFFPITDDLPVRPEPDIVEIPEIRYAPVEGVEQVFLIDITDENREYINHKLNINLQHVNRWYASGESLQNLLGVNV